MVLGLSICFLMWESSWWAMPFEAKVLRFSHNPEFFRLVINEKM